MDLFDLESLVKILFSAVLGAAIGLERGTHGRPAGLRTHALVCIASTLLIVVSRTGALVGLQGSSGYLINVDPARMAAGIVTGIGFLGAGAILRVGSNLIRGLTTAACIWFVAAIGITVGMGAYGIAAAATIAGLVILIVLDRLEGSMGSVAYRTLVVDISNEKRAAVEGGCRALIKQNKMRIQHISYRINNIDAEARLSFSLRINARRVMADIVGDVAQLPGVLRVSWS
ncbi:MAG: MgtC/SapB family protein [Myxococcota bacterium]|nr:MgtC/SapB family protein [Myxococcota bacterium]